MKRIVVIADLHCGHITGLTPPSWNNTAPKSKGAQFRKKLWDFYKKSIEELQPIDTLVLNGDSIDGLGAKSAGAEKMEGNWEEQVEMATCCIDLAGASKKYLIAGTPYHVGVDADMEGFLAQAVNAEYCKRNKSRLHDFLSLNVNGLLFDFCHKTSRSVIPHGRYTAMARNPVWDLMRAEKESSSPHDIFIRSHAHYFVNCAYPGKLMIITPALQGYSKYGDRQVTGGIDIGFIYFDVDKKGEYGWGSKLLNPAFTKREVYNG